MFDMLDLTDWERKKYTTRDGRPVRILCVDAEGDYPMKVPPLWKIFLGVVLFVFILCYFSTSHADQGGDFYEPHPQGGCFAYPDSKEDGESHARAEADFINYHDDYRLLPINDQLVVFTMCNQVRARCYRSRVICGGKNVYDVWFWREVQRKEKKRK